MDDVNDTPEEDGGDGGGWLATFADLMALLMCFFVLLLSFSEIEAKKYKQVAGSMSNAFGVQREIPTKEIPKGTSIIAQEFSPGKPTQTFVVVMKQESTNEYKQNLDFSDSDYKGKANQTLENPEDVEEINENPPQEMQESQQSEESKETDEPPTIDPAILEAAKMIAKALNEEIEMGMIEVVATPERVAIRVREKGSFESGSAALAQSFRPVLGRISETLKQTSGDVVVAGHTDNVPIRTARFPSNWELSSARAAAFVHFMTDESAFEPERLQIRAFGETRPLAPNDSRENRAQNRRVEISLVMKTAQLAAASKLPPPAEELDGVGRRPDAPLQQDPSVDSPPAPDEPAPDLSHSVQ
ncbi:MAG: MotB family protein [Pseudomonadota bacterium]